MTRLRDDLWSVMEPVYKQILVHPFVTGLTDGSLPMQSFAHYVRQDSHYLRDYSRALALIASKAPDESTTAFFAAHAHQAIEVEASLHAGFADELAAGHPEAFSRPAGPTTLAYTSYVLRACSQGDFAQGLAAVLPCYWIYAEVGNALVAASSPEPLYARWIAGAGRGRERWAPGARRSRQSWPASLRRPGFARRGCCQLMCGSGAGGVVGELGDVAADRGGVVVHLLHAGRLGGGGRGRGCGLLARSLLGRRARRRLGRSR